MHLRGFRLVLVIVALSLLLGAFFFTPLSIFAQDTPTLEPIPEPTVVAPPIDEVTVPLDYLWGIQNLANYAVIMAGILGTVTVGGSLLLLNRQTKDAMEKVYMSAPPEHQRIANRIVDFADSLVQQLTNLVKLAREVTDGKPNVDPVDTTEVPRASPPADL